MKLTAVGKYHFSSDIRTPKTSTPLPPFSLLHTVQFLRTSACVCRTSEIVSHSSCRASAILKYFCPLKSYYSLVFFIAYAFIGEVHVFAGKVKIVRLSSCRTSAILKYFCPLKSYYSLVFFIAYAFIGEVHVFAGQVKIVRLSSCRTTAILKYFCPLCCHVIFNKSLEKC